MFSYGGNADLPTSTYGFAVFSRGKMGEYDYVF